MNVGGKVNYATGFTAKDKVVEPALGWAVRAGYLQPLWQAVASFAQSAGSNLVGATYFQKVPLLSPGFIDISLILLGY